MSDWITGCDVCRRLNLQPIELYENHIRKGALQPYDSSGQEMTPLDALEYIFAEEMRNADHGTDQVQCEGTNETFLVRRSVSLEQNHQRIKERISTATWTNPDIPADYLPELMNVLSQKALYKIDQYNACAGNQPKDYSPKLSPNQRHRLACIKVAKRLWKQAPDLTIEKMATDRVEIVHACDGIKYKPKTIRSWIHEYAPNRKPGRRPKKK